MRRLPLILLLSVALVGACGGGDKKKEDAKGATTTTVASDATTSSVAGGGTNTTTRSATTVRGQTTVPGQTTTTTAGGGSPTTTAPGSTTTTEAPLPPSSFPVTVKLAKSCQRPGGSQTITVKAKPKAIVTYVTNYSDGESHHNNNGGVADGQGVYTDTYVVSIEAPKGPARVIVNVSAGNDGLGFGEARFNVGC